MPATTKELEFHETRLVEKIARLKNGELNAQQQEGDGRQEAAIFRAEKQLREVRAQKVEAEKPELSKGRKDS